MDVNKPAPVVYDYGVHFEQEIYQKQQDCNEAMYHQLVPPQHHNGSGKIDYSYNDHGYQISVLGWSPPVGVSGVVV